MVKAASRAQRTVMGASRRVSLWLTWAFLVQTSALLSHVEKYEVVRPLRLPGRQRRSLQDQDQDQDQLYPDTLQYELTVEGTQHTLQLEKNRNLVGSDFTETRYSDDGSRVTTSPKVELCYYHGHVRGLRDSAVSVGICSGISGFVRARRRVYFIEPLEQSDHGDHAVYRQEHLKVEGRPGCGSTSNSTAYDRDGSPALGGLFRARAWKSKPAAGPDKFVELFVVADNTEYQRYKGQTKSRILEAVNHINKLYRPLNIWVMLVGLEIWSHRDYIHVDLDSEKTLDSFVRWRRSDLLPRKKHDTAQFVTGKDFEGDTVGLANKFAMCMGNSGGVNQDHHDNPIGLASTIAHEMGHNFGLSHDGPGCTCGPSYGGYGGGDCVMADRLRTGSAAFPEFFSDCSVEQLAQFLERARPSCLSRPSTSVRTLDGGPRCGNGLLEPGEACDCGTTEECQNPCCDASTCRLTEGSQCAHGLCCHNCQLQQAGSVCRKSAGECDLPEYCTGASADCPEDSFHMNGKPCFDRAEGYCHDGRCPTHLQHCWRQFGPGTVVGMDLCFDLNRQGKDGTNCGRNRLGFVPCTTPNVKCGSIFCGGGGESITGKRAGYTVMGLECKQAVDDDEDRNIHMVPEGARCGVDKVCLGHRCVDVSVYGRKEDCAKKCNNNGVCNHRKECHCDPGWAPPYCDVQFADLPQGQGVLIPAVCASVSGLLVITAVIAGLMCCRRERVENCISKRKVHSAPDKLNPMFQELSVKDRPQISPPTFMESTAPTQSCVPLMGGVAPSRPAPQPPGKPSPASSTSQPEPTQTPQPPSKPLPPLNKVQYQGPSKTSPPPPVPPVKPSPPPPVPPVRPSPPPPVPPVKPSPPPPVPPVRPSPPPPAPPVKPSPPPLPSAKPRVHRLP